MQETRSRLMSKSEYARHRQVRPSLVTAWKKAGRIAMVGEQVDAFASDAMLAQTLDPARGGKGGKSERAGTVVPKAPRRRPETGPGSAAAVPSTPNTPGTPQSFQASKARREAALAEQEEFQAALLRREVFRLADLERATGEVAGVVEQELGLLPARVASKLAAMYGLNQRDVMNATEDEITAARANIVATIRALPGSAVRTVQ